MITEDYVSFEVAKLLKEKGFDAVECQNSPHFSYNIDGQFSGPSWDSEYNAPTLQMAMKWLREMCNLSVEVHFFLNEENNMSSWNYDIIDTVTYCNKAKYDMRETFKTFEESCEAAIKYCLENLI